MYAVAQHVWSRTSDERGINCSLYRHPGDGALDWKRRDVVLSVDRDPGEYVTGDYQVRPPSGNEVLSYLDVVAPDGWPVAAIERALASVAPSVGAAPRALVQTLDSVGIRFDVAMLRLRGSERTEFDLLRRRLIDFLAQHAGPA